MGLLSLCNTGSLQSVLRMCTALIMLIIIITCSLLDSRAGSTSFTVLSTSTPPTRRKHFLEASTSFRVSITNLRIQRKSKYKTGCQLMNKDCSFANAVHNVPVFIDIHLQLCSLWSHAALFLPHSLKRCDNLGNTASRYQISILLCSVKSIK